MTRSPAPAWFTDALDALRRGDTDVFMSMYTTDAVHEVPLAPKGRPSVLAGKDAITQYTAQLPRVARFDVFTDVRTHVSEDVLIAEFTGTGTRIPGDEPLRLAYVWFITHKNGRVSHIRDYAMPRP
ncbi:MULTISPECIES: nuclear transport factor 2 family protein [unclassified Streptomyces]|uniref:nuclear transport factor 2 family protein n=1 Tax=unclassified Streptomyces TaxID=2593676 RepID=UPI000FFF4545|nr:MULTISPECIES: nuclear transport factor 2 family protein [unclassified Streptomyces]